MLSTLPGLSSHKHIVRMGESKTSHDKHDELVTYSLGLCLAVSLYDRQEHIGGLAHFLLPNSSIDPKKAQLNPYLFVNTGMPVFFQAVLDLGAAPERIEVKVAGAADLRNAQKLFDVGHRNYLALHAFLDDRNLKITAESIGGHVSRTMRFNMDSGEAIVEIPGQGATTL